MALDWTNDEELRIPPYNGVSPLSAQLIKGNVYWDGLGNNTNICHGYRLIHTATQDVLCTLTPLRIGLSNPDRWLIMHIIGTQAEHSTGSNKRYEYVTGLASARHKAEAFWAEVCNVQ